jgi:hypothetical protein
MKKQKRTYFIALFAVITFLSCREEIITPGNFAGNINEPLQFRELDYYNFLINCKDATFKVIDFPSFTTNQAKVSLQLDEYQSGSVYIKIVDTDTSIVYKILLNGNAEEKDVKLRGNIPDKIEMDFRYFTGNLKLIMNKYIN